MSRPHHRPNPVRKSTTTQEGFQGNQLCFVSAAVVPTTTRPSLPLITSRKLSYPPKFTKNREAWVENLDTIESLKLGLTPLHAEVFGAFPRIDTLHWNVDWQQKYRRVDWETTQTRAERRGGGRKPWPQKGTGRARHGSIRSPLWKGGRHSLLGLLFQPCMLP